MGQRIGSIADQQVNLARVRRLDVIAARHRGLRRQAHVWRRPGDCGGELGYQGPTQVFGRGHPNVWRGSKDCSVDTHFNASLTVFRGANRAQPLCFGTKKLVRKVGAHPRRQK